jgi:lipoate-protein ligase A
VLTAQFCAQFTVRHGEIQAASIAGLEYRYAVDEASQDVILSSGLVNERLHHIQDWRTTLEQASPVPVDVDGVGEWLNQMFGIEASATPEGGTVSDSIVQTISGTAIGKYLNINTDL